MTKKILIVLFALLILSVPYQQQYQQNVHAAIVSKVASAAAKKVAKVPIKELTKDIAFDLAAQAIGQQFNEKLTFKFEEGYEGYCMTEIKSDGSCGRVVQVKKDLTVEEINRIDNQVETEMDKAITGGKGFPKWQKFLDWFVPIWLISAGVTAITYAFDSDVRSLFNEIGYNTLVSLGLIKPVETGLPSPVEDIKEPVLDDNKEYVGNDGNKTSPKDSHVYTLNGSYNYDYFSDPIFPNRSLLENVLVSTKITRVNSAEKLTVFKANLADANQPYLYGFDEKSFVVGNTSVMNYNDSPTSVIQVNGQTVYTGKAIYSNSVYQLNVDLDPELQSLMGKEYEWVYYRAPYVIDGKQYNDLLLKTVSGESVAIQTKSEPVSMPSFYRATNNFSFENASGMTIQTKIFKNYFAEKIILPPLYEEAEDAIPASVTKYEKDDKIALVPPAAVPIREVGTGETVTRTPAKTPNEEPIYQKPDGTIVPPDNIEVGDPVVTPSKPGQLDPGGKPIPEGTPVATPTPTPSNPTPAPVPLVPGEVPTNPTEPDAPTVPPGTEPPPTEQPFPEEPSCDAKLNFPRYIPFMNTLSNAFPFSIPWDIERALNAAFGEIGSERPGFDYTFDFMGSEKTWRVEVPKFFDSWKPFTDGLLLLIFDVGIMFGIYRFMKGGGS